MNKIDFDLQLPTKISNFEKQVSLIERKISVISEILASPAIGEDLTPEGSLKLIELEERRTLAEADLLAKKDWLKKLKAKLRIDEKEFEKNLSESNSQWQKVVDIAEKWISNTEEKNNKKPSYLTLMTAFIIDNLSLAMEDKEVGAKVHYYNLLKKQLAELGVWN